MRNALLAGLVLLAACAEVRPRMSAQELSAIPMDCGRKEELINLYRQHQTPFEERRAVSFRYITQLRGLRDVDSETQMIEDMRSGRYDTIASIKIHDLKTYCP